jgi:hypothetical protein
MTAGAAGAAGVAVTVTVVVAGAALVPQQVGAAGAAQALHECNPANFALSRSSRPTRQGSEQAVVKPVKIGRRMSGVPQAGAQTGAAGAQAGSQDLAQCPKFGFRLARRALIFASSPKRGPQASSQLGIVWQGVAHELLMVGVPQPPQFVPLTTMGASAPRAIDEASRRIVAFTGSSPG